MNEAQKQEEAGPILGDTLAPERALYECQQATIGGVTLLRKQDGRIFFVIKVVSRNRNYVNTLDLQVPNAFEEGVKLGSKFDPMTLPEDDEKGRQRRLFRSNFANRKHDAWLQRLVFNPLSVARRLGRDPVKLDIIIQPQSLEDYCHNLHEMLVGVECLMFEHAGKVWDLTWDSGSYRDPKFKRYALAWEKD